MYKVIADKSGGKSVPLSDFDINFFNAREFLHEKKISDKKLLKDARELNRKAGITKLEKIGISKEEIEAILS